MLDLHDCLWSNSLLKIGRKPTVLPYASRTTIRGGMGLLKYTNTDHKIDADGATSKS